MRILLYRAGAESAFAMHFNSCDVRIVKDTVYIMDREDVLKQYELVGMSDPVWTDKTKSAKEILVKLTVKEAPEITA